MTGLVDDLIRYEDGSMTAGEALAFFGRLIETGTIMGLQGSYQRGALSLVDQGFLSPDGSITDLGRTLEDA